MPTPIETYKVPELNMVVDVFKTSSGNLCGSVTIQREIIEEDYSLANDEAIVHPYDAAMDGVESLLLAMVCEGYDLREERIKKAIRITLDALSNNLGVVNF